jgi:PadR family transcriptional regulator AphA
MSLEAAIMGFLAEEPRSGYELKTRCFEEQAGAFWTADQAQIYRTLERLQASRMVTFTRKRQSGKPDRKIYRLTSAGASALTAWLASPSPLTPPRDHFLLQVFFSAQLTDGEIVASLLARRDAHQSRLGVLRQEIVAQGDSVRARQRVRLLRDAAFDGAIARERATVDWLDDTIEAIESGRLPVDGHGGGFGEGGLAETSSA